MKPAGDSMSHSYAGFASQLQRESEAAPRVQWFAAVLPRGTGVRSVWDADPDGVRSEWDVPSEAIEGRMCMK